jgi:hypothetical protein
MPTPSQIAAAKKASQPDDYFVVHEVVELVDEGDDGFGEEDLASAVPTNMYQNKPSDDRGGPVILRITQATFDAAVIENMEEFDMAYDKAIAEAAKEFKLQGVCLGSISVDPKRLNASLVA